MGNFEIIIVDNGSSDNSMKLVKNAFPMVNFLQYEINLGFSKAANIGIDRGKGEFFLILHPDTTLFPGTINYMYDYLSEHPDVAIVGGNLIYPDDSFNLCPIKKRSLRREFIDFGFPFNKIDDQICKILNYLFNRNFSIYWDHKTISETASVWNACMMFRRDLLDVIEGFSEEFFVWFADTDFCYRARNAGYKLHYLPKASVTHYEKQSKGYLDNLETNYKFNSLLVEGLLRKDLDTFISRHYKPLYAFISRKLHYLAVIKAKFRKFF